MEGFVWDVEADSLYLQCKKIWYIRLTSLDETRSIKIMPFKDGVDAAREQFLEWLHSFEDGCYIVAHNQLSFDVWAIWKLLNIVPRVGKQGKDWLDGKHVQYIDTFVLSMYLNPDSPKHSLEYLASGSEDEKMDYRAALVAAGAMVGNEPKGYEFTFYHPLMDDYCDDDVKALAGVFRKLWAKAKEMYEDAWLHPSFRQMQKDYWLYSAQAHTGAKFHQERAKALVAHIEEKMAELKAQVDPELPPRPLKTAEQAFYKMPAKPYTKSGELSATMVKWLEKHNAILEDGIVKAYGLEVPLQAGEVLPVKLPMEIEDNTELKDWFLANGWKPHDDFWNFKKDPATGKPVRDDKGKFIKTTPKIQHQGQICPNLLKIEGDIPKKVVKFLSYRNRKGVVEGWLNNWRLAFDGRISAEISGYAPTSRVKHRTIVNCPKADPKVLLGAEMRDLWVVEEGNWFLGTDAAALENRTLSHYTTKYDGGAFAKMNLEGDIHSFNAFAFFPHLLKEFDPEDPENKENPKFKSWRSKAKTGAYLLAFGGGAAKLASSLGLSQKEGKVAYENYWEKNAGLGKLKEAVEQYFKTKGKGKYIPAIDGRLVSVRGANVLISCLGQGLGAIAMSYAACLMDNWLGELYLDDLGRPYYNFQGFVVKRIMQQHDEYSWEVEDGAEEVVGEMSVRAIIKAGELLKLSLPLAGEGKKSYNGSWKDVH